MKNNMLSAVLLTGLILTSGMALGVDTSSGTLTVTAELASAINLAFVQDQKGVVTTGTASAAILDFGTVSQFTATTSKVTNTVGPGSFFTVSTPFDILVTQSNGSSASYILTAKLSTLDTDSNVWTIDSSTLSSTVASQLTDTGAYGSTVARTLKLTIPFSEQPNTISNTIDFVATAN